MKPIGNKLILIKQPKKVGLETKLPSKDELLITMIKLRLELRIIDLFQLSRISQCLCIQIFSTAKYFKPLVLCARYVIHTRNHTKKIDNLKKKLGLKLLRDIHQDLKITGIDKSYWV